MIKKHAVNLASFVISEFEKEGFIMLKKNIYLMYAIACLQGMVFYGPIATLYRQAQGLSVFEITLIESISLILCLLLELPWGIAADRIGYKRTMIVCCLLYFVSKIVFWRAAGFPAFLLERILLSVVMAGFSGVDASILYLSAEQGKSQKVFGVYNGLGTAGLLLAALVYSAVVGEDYRLAGFLTVISYGIAAALSLFLTEVKHVERETQEEQKRTGAKEFVSSLRQTISDKYLLLFLLGVAFLNETHQTVTVFLNQLLYVRAGIGNRAIGYLYILVTVIGMCGVFSDRLTRRMGEHFMIRACYIVAAASCLLLAFSDCMAGAVCGIVALRIVFGLFSPLQTRIQNEQVITADRATALSINAVIIDSVGVGTNLVFGMLAEKSLSAALISGAFLCVIGFIFVELWKHRG